MNDPGVTKPPEIAAVLGVAAGRTRRQRLPPGLWLLVALVAGGVGSLFLRPDHGGEAVRYQTEEVRRGDLTVIVSATGKLEPTNQVDVGSELSGIVEAVFVEDNDRVKKGQVLARLDLSRLEDAVARSAANLAAVEAQVQQTQATVVEARGALARLLQVAELSGGKVPSGSELDTARANLQRAVANAASAQASVVQGRATLKSDQTNLFKGSIRAPIDGVVLARKVEPGQTVAASLQAPVLFTLAEDLAQMELHVDVDEADVGQVDAGQPATFTVDAYPKRRYPAAILRVDYGAQTTNQVVTYRAVLQVENRDLSLRPGMTATAEITSASHPDVLLIPNAALRYSPPTGPTPKPKPKPKGNGLVGAMVPRFPRRAPSPLPPKANPDDRPRVWVLRAGQAVAVEVEVGLSNGQMTEVVGGPVQMGEAVITDTLEGGGR